MSILFIIIVIVVIYAFLQLIAQNAAPHRPSSLSDEDILHLARQGQKIRAIKEYRHLHGAGLKEAKEAVEAMMQENE